MLRVRQFTYSEAEHGDAVARVELKGRRNGELGGHVVELVARCLCDEKKMKDRGNG